MVSLREQKEILLADLLGVPPGTTLFSWLAKAAAAISAQNHTAQPKEGSC